MQSLIVISAAIASRASLLSPGWQPGFVPCTKSYARIQYVCVPLSTEIRTHVHAQIACWFIPPTFGAKFWAAYPVENQGMLLFLPLFSGHDSSIRLWDLESRACVQEMTCHRVKNNESIHAVAMHPTMPFAASAGADAICKVYTSLWSGTPYDHEKETGPLCTWILFPVVVVCLWVIFSTLMLTGDSLRTWGICECASLFLSPPSPLNPLSSYSRFVAFFPLLRRFFTPYRSCR